MKGLRIEMKHKGKCEKNSCCGLCCTKIENVGVVYGQQPVLKDVNIHIHCGELTALIGPNGAGKSTLLKALLGEIKHTGQLKFVDAKGVHTGHPVIGYVPQNLNLDQGSPTSVLDIFMACKSKFPTWLGIPKNIENEVKESLARVKASHLIHRKIGALSGGELQRVLLALALDPIPDILLLDEPVSGIDRNGMELFYKIVSEIRRKYDLSVILVSHDLDMVRKYADRVVLLNGTVISNGTPQEVYNDKRFLKTFGINWVRGM